MYVVGMYACTKVYAGRVTCHCDYYRQSYYLLTPRNTSTAISQRDPGGGVKLMAKALESVSGHFSGTRRERIVSLDPRSHAGEPSPWLSANSLGNIFL